MGAFRAAAPLPPLTIDLAIGSRWCALVGLLLVLLLTLMQELVERCPIGKALLAEGFREKLRCPSQMLVFLEHPATFGMVCLDLLLEGPLVRLHREAEIGLAAV